MLYHESLIVYHFQSYAHLGILKSIDFNSKHFQLIQTKSEQGLHNINAERM